MGSDPQEAHRHTAQTAMDRLTAMVATQGDITARTSELWQRLLDRTAALTGATSAALLVPDGEVMVVRAESGAETSGHSHPANGSLAAQALRTGMTLVAGDTENDERTDAALYRQLGARSVLAAPVWSEGAWAAVLIVSAPEPQAFGDGDVHTVQIMAGLAGAALQAKEMPASAPSGPALELMEWQALHDPVTELPNRTLLFDRLRQAIRVSQREDEPLAILFLATHGGRQEPIDDVQVRETAARLLDTLRSSDTVARVGGDLFGILLPGANAVGAVGTAKKVLRALGPSEARIGIAICPEHGDDPNVLLERAHDALVAAPTSGNVAVFEER